MTVVLIHLGLDRKKTRSVMDRIPDRVRAGMSIFELDEDLKSRIRCSSKVPKIERYPVFLVTLNGVTRVYYDSETDQVIGLIDKVL